MKHVFRKSAFNGENFVLLTLDAIQLYSSRGTLNREIEFGEIAEIHEYSGMSAVDKNQKKFEIRIARIVPHRGRAITIQSSSYVGAAGRMQMAKDNSKTFHRLMSTLKSRTVACNPHADLVTGNRIASVMGYVLALFFLVMLLLTLSAPIYSIFNPARSLWEIWPVLLASLVSSTIFGRWALSMAKMYAPRREKLSESVLAKAQS